MTGRVTDSPAAFEVLPQDRRPAHRSRAGRRGSVAAFGLVFLVLLSGGCGGGKLIPLGSSADFQRHVLDSRKPVLVQFYKSGCMWCSMQEPALDRLAGDYGDRVVFAKYCLKDWLGSVTNWEIRTKYDIGWYPTVILFVHGREKKRWVTHFDEKSYRKALDEVLGTPKPRTVVAPARR